MRKNTVIEIVVWSLRDSRHELEWASSWIEIGKRYANFLVNIIGDHAGYVDILGRSVHSIKKNTEALVVASMEIGTEVNADKTKYTVVSRI